jgi:hypothetical protein
MMGFSFLKVCFGNSRMPLYFQLFIYIKRSHCYPGIGGKEGMAKEDLLFILKKLLQTDAYLEFLLQLDETDMRTLIACIRDRIDRAKN